MRATIQVQLTPSSASPQILGTMITWTASATDSNPGPVTYKFEVAPPGSNPTFSTISDFSLGNTLNWTPNLWEGTYQIRVTARDYLAGQTAQTVSNFGVEALVTGNQPVVTATANPLIALFSAPSCTAGSFMRVGFELSGSTAMTYTNFRSCHGGTMNFYIAGMRHASTYNMHYEVATGKTIVPNSTILPFTTGPLPSTITFPVVEALMQPSPQADVSSGVVFTGFSAIGPCFLGAYPEATDLEGHVLWYYGLDHPQIVRIVPGNNLLGTTLMMISEGPGTGTGSYGTNTDQELVREVDLAGNIIRQTNADRVSEQLVAAGTDPISNFHHEAIRLPNGHTITFGSLQGIYPAGTQGSSGPIDIIGLMIIELDENFQVVWHWNAFDHAGGGTQLDINRAAVRGESCVVNASCFQALGCPAEMLANTAADWLHGNSAQYEPSDGSLLISLRDQDWVLKIDYNNGQGTGDILWRLGLGGDFTMNSTDPYPWFSGQHYVEFQYGGQQILSLFDDGNTRVLEFPGETSRGQVLNVDQTDMQVSLNLNVSLDGYSPALGTAQLLTNGDYAFEPGYINPGVHSYEQSIEVTPSASVAYEYQGDDPAYRSWRMPSLYSLAVVNSPSPITLACASNAGTVGVSYSSSLTASGGVPPYMFSISAGSLPQGLSLNSSTGAITGAPTRPGTYPFTATVVDSIGSDVASANCGMTIAPAPVTLACPLNTAQDGTAYASALTAGGGVPPYTYSITAGSLPLVLSLNSTTGGITGTPTETGTFSFTASVADSTGTPAGKASTNCSITSSNPTAVVININTQKSSVIPAKFSGFSAPQPRNGVEYYDPKFLSAVEPLNPGWIRFPAGTVSMPFDWQAGHTNTGWLDELIAGNPPLVDSFTAGELVTAQQLTQAKGGVYFSDFANFVQSLGANTAVTFNAYTDTSPSSAADMVTAAQGYGLNVLEWELANEPYLFPLIFPSPASYASAMNSPYFSEIVSANPSATVGLFYAGQFTGPPVNYTAWDDGMAAYAPRYWNAVSFHMYPISSSVDNTTASQILNGVLAHGTVDYVNSYLLPLIGANTPIFVTELNASALNNLPLTPTLYNGIFLAEYIARMSTCPNVRGVAAHALYMGNSVNFGLIRAVNDYESYLIGQVSANPNYSTNTATDPNTPFEFYTSAPALALAVANQAINNSTHIWPTTVTGGAAVPIQGYDGNPIPAIYSQAYQGDNGLHYLLITNKSGYSSKVTIQVNGTKLGQTLTVTYVSNSDKSISNTASAPNTVQIETVTSGNPVVIGPYSVTTVQWKKA
ncbi:MAG: aryl-sulfate sulfotransferase [Bryobacteraceae bacterium]